MFAWALSPACRRIGSRPTLPETIRQIRSRWSWPFRRSQLRNSSTSASVRRDPLVVVLEHPVDEDRKLV